MGEENKVLWSDKRRNIFGLPWTFTKYTLTEEKLLIQTGMLSIKEEEIQLYRITDITLFKSFWQRIFKMGTIHCCSADKTTPEFSIRNIKDPSKVKELLAKKIEDRRDKKRIYAREIISGPMDEEIDHSI